MNKISAGFSVLSFPVIGAGDVPLRVSWPRMCRPTGVFGSDSVNRITRTANTISRSSRSYFSSFICTSSVLNSAVRLFFLTFVLRFVILRFCSSIFYCSLFILFYSSLFVCSPVLRFVILRFASHHGLSKPKVTVLPCTRRM